MVRSFIVTTNANSTVGYYLSVIYGRHSVPRRQSRVLSQLRISQHCRMRDLQNRRSNICRTRASNSSRTMPSFQSTAGFRRTTVMVCISLCESFSMKSLTFWVSQQIQSFDLPAILDMKWHGFQVFFWSVVTQANFEQVSYICPISSLGHRRL